MKQWDPKLFGFNIDERESNLVHIICYFSDRSWAAITLIDGDSVQDTISKMQFTGTWESVRPAIEAIKTSLMKDGQISIDRDGLKSLTACFVRQSLADVAASASKYLSYDDALSLFQEVFIVDPIMT